MSEWCPIETAPKDGTMIMVGASDWIAISNDYSDERWWTWHPPVVGCRPVRSNGRAESPTHWMPLPEPPK